MNWKNRLKNYNFWISMFSAVLLILQALKIEFDVAYVNEIFTAVLGLLVVVGIIIDPTKVATVNKTKANEQTVLEEKAEDETSKQSTEQTQTTLPIDEKNEIDFINSENDFQATLNKISLDLDNKLKEIEAINQQTAQCLKEIQKNKTETEKSTMENVLPAVAEMDNPYIDLMK